MKKIDEWIVANGPAAIVIKEPLMPVEGYDGVFFPPTYAGSGEKGDYNIDSFSDGRNVCVVDSVGSQANRMEPLFSLDPYSYMIPQIVIEAGDKKINLLNAGHRAGDAIVRCSQMQEELHLAFKEVLNGNVEILARISPTSIIFGVWDSRDTQAKLPRIISSVIRAFNVLKLSRSAQYVPAAEYVNSGMLPEPSNESVKKAYAERGFIHVPSSAPGGVISTGGLSRDITLSLSALRLLNAGKDVDKTFKLRRYILGLSLVAMTSPRESYLRQGCNLVPDPEKPVKSELVQLNGKRIDFTITHELAIAYAHSASSVFGVGKSRIVAFDKKMSELDISKSKKIKKAE